MRRTFARAALAVALALAILAAVALVRAWRLPSRQPYVEPAPAAAVDAEAAAERLAAAVRFPTVSAEPASADTLRALHAWLATAYPLVHGGLDREVVGGGALLFTWAGSDPALDPILLTAHLDVVPVEPGTEGRWSHPPFAGAIAEGYVWGRGTLDDKSSALAILEAVESLLGEGFAPSRTVLVALGHDEEVGGRDGAALVARRLVEKGLHPEIALDEGSIVAEGMPPGLDRPVALVGVAEKGYVTLELAVEAPGGHASMPPRETAIGTLARAVAALERSPFPGGIRGPTRDMFAFLAPELAFGQRLVFANLWLFGPLVERRIAALPAGDALLRTTTAPTILEGGVKENVLPARARAVVNFRIFPGETVAGVESRVRRIVDDDRVRIARHGEHAGADPSRVSSTESWGFETLARTIRETFPDALVAPYVVVATTDARHYETVARDVYRFLPLRLGPDDLPRFHGADERVGVQAHAGAIRFYRRLIENSAGGAPSAGAIPVILNATYAASGPDHAPDRVAERQPPGAR